MRVDWPIVTLDLVREGDIMDTGGRFWAVTHVGRLDHFIRLELSDFTGKRCIVKGKAFDLTRKRVVYV